MNGFRPLAPPSGARFRGEQDSDSGVVEPEITLSQDWQIMAQRTREHRCVDPAGRGAGEDVDDDAQLYLVADLLQKLKIVGLGIVFRIIRVGLVEERGLGSARTVGNPMQGA